MPSSTKARLFTGVVAAVLIVTLVQWNPQPEPTYTANQEWLNVRNGYAVRCLPPAYVPDDYLQKPISLKKGIGQVSYPIQTPYPKAQTFFNQGMTYLYNFEWVQAARSFFEAKRFDSTSAMISFGLANAYANMIDSNEARRFSQLALQQSKTPCEWSLTLLLEQKKYKEEQMPTQYDWHHTHNLELLAYCHQYKGQLAKAETIFAKLDTIKPFSIQATGRIRKGYPEYLLQNGRYLDAVKIAQTMKGSQYSTGIAYSLAGLGYVLAKDTASARLEAFMYLKRLDSIFLQRKKEGYSKEEAMNMQSLSRGILTLVESGIALQADPQNSELRLKSTKVQTAMLKQTGPDAWIAALYFLQLVTNITWSGGNMELAETSARTMLQHDPNYGGGHWWLAKILHRQGKLVEANAELAKARTAYEDADPAFLRTLTL